MQNNNLDELILDIIKNKKPQSVRELAKITRKSVNVSEREIIDCILKLQQNDLITLRDNLPILPLSSYLRTNDARWFWVIITLSVITTILAFTTSSNSYPLIYAKNICGIIFVLFLPGYAFLRALSPNFSLKNSNKNSVSIYQFALNIGLSIALVSIAGLFLFYSPWGLYLNTIVITMLAFILFFSILAIVRDYSAKNG